MAKKNAFHSVTLDAEKCKGCINCIKRCPTEAIRVRNGKAHIINERCIDCGECIRICPHHAKRPIHDSLSAMSKYKYIVALPAPSLYGQFNNLDDVNIVLEGLLKIGFDAVFEVSKAAEIISNVTKKYITEKNLKRPVINSACPAVVRLIRIRFPELLDNILPLTAPVDLAASMAAEEAMKKTGLPREEIGIIFISPCAAKNTALRYPVGIEKSQVNAVVAIKDIYPLLIGAMKEISQSGDVSDDLSKSGIIGVSWANSGGEAAGTLIENYLAADGVENVIGILEGLEDDKFQNLEFVELNVCSGGCVGGVLTVENPYAAKARLKRLRKYMPISVNHAEGIPKNAVLSQPIDSVNVLKLSDDIHEAMQKLVAMDALANDFPGLDCGSCGAPSCHALAEDIIRGHASEEDCIFRYRAHMQGVISQLSKLDQYIPPPFRNIEKK